MGYRLGWPIFPPPRPGRAKGAVTDIRRTLKGHSMATISKHESVTVAPPKGIMAREPAHVIGVITGLVTAALALIVAFGVDLDPTQQAAILGIAAALAPIIAGIITRNAVFSPQSTQRIANAAAETGVAEVPPPPA